MQETEGQGGAPFTGVSLFICGASYLGEDAKCAQFFKISRGSRFRHNKKPPEQRVAPNKIANGPAFLR